MLPRRRRTTARHEFLRAQAPVGWRCPAGLHGWLLSGLEDEDFTGTIGTGARPIEEVLRTLAEAALTNTAPHADNTSAAGLRWLG